MKTTKGKDIKIRINENLKIRYQKALAESGVSATDHLTNVIFDFVTKHEAKKK